MTDPATRTGIMLGQLIRLLADLAIISIAVVLILSAAGSVTLH